jgi:hypothetical protein
MRLALQPLAVGGQYPCVKIWGAKSEAMANRYFAVRVGFHSYNKGQATFACYFWTTFSKS